MEKIEKSKTFQLDTTTFVIKMKRNDSDNLFVSLEIKNNALAEPIQLNLSSTQLEDILYKLQDYHDDIKRIQLLENEIKPHDVQPIITNFLRGVTLKDLHLQYGYNEKDISTLLVKHNIEIVEGINMPNSKKYIKFPKSNSRPRK